MESDEDTEEPPNGCYGKQMIYGGINAVHNVTYMSESAEI